MVRMALATTNRTRESPAGSAPRPPEGSAERRAQGLACGSLEVAAELCRAWQSRPAYLPDGLCPGVCLPSCLTGEPGRSWAASSAS